MSACHIDQPTSSSRIPGMNGFLWVYAFNDSGDVAYLNSKCTRTHPDNHAHDLPWVALPHDPILGWYVIYPLIHEYVDGVSRHTLSTRLIDSFGQQLCYSAVTDIGIDPPGAVKSMHGTPEKDAFRTAKIAFTDNKHWLAGATSDLFSAGLGAGFVHLMGGAKLDGKTHKKMNMAARLRLPRTNSNEPQRHHKLADEKEYDKTGWEISLTDWSRMHGTTAVVRFTNPDEPNPLLKHVPIPIPLLDSSREATKAKYPGFDVQMVEKGKPLVYRPHPF